MKITPTKEEKIENWKRIVSELSQQNARLQAALEEILTANDRFRAQLPPDWESDPVNDACIKARKLAKEGK